MNQLQNHCVFVTAVALTIAGGVGPAAWGADGSAQVKRSATAPHQTSEPSRGGGANAPELSTSRWSEQAYGLSLRPPAQARRIEPTADGSLVKFVNHDLYTIELSIRHSDKPVSLEDVTRAMGGDAVFGSQLAILVKGTTPKIAGRPGSLSYYRIDDDKKRGGKWMLGEALMKIDPQTYAMFQLRTSVDAFDSNRKLFEAMLKSVRMMPLAQLNRIRATWIEAGVQCAANITPAKLRQAMAPEQWYRILKGGKDVGYRRVQQKQTTMLGLPGIRIDVDSRIILGANSYDTKSFFFASDEGTNEIWSVRTAQRSKLWATKLPPALKASPPPVKTYVETGLRSVRKHQGVITVHREKPGSIKDLKWAVPPKGYISIVETRLLPHVLPRDQQADLGFYAYSSTAGKLALRTIQVFPKKDGGYIIREKSAPDASPRISTYDKNGRLIKRQTADGRVLVPATPAQMKAIWGIK